MEFIFLTFLILGTNWQKVTRHHFEYPTKLCGIHVLNKAYQYILGIKNPAGEPIHISRRKTGFVGFLVAIESVKMIFQTLVDNKDGPLKYLFTYKLIQDHLELFLVLCVQQGGSLRHVNAYSCEVILKKGKETVRKETQ